jgi:hypothetical protein
VDALPLTVNGKVDERALPWPPSTVGTERPATPAAFASDTVDTVEAVWRSVLPAARFGPDDNFFDIGGSSMHVVEVHRRLQERLGVDGLEMIELFTHTTTRQLAAHIDAIRGTTHA